MMSSGSMDDTKNQLLFQANRELITSFSAVNDFELTADNVTASSAGYVRIKGNPVYSNGTNLGWMLVNLSN